MKKKRSFEEVFAIRYKRFLQNLQRQERKDGDFNGRK